VFEFEDLVLNLRDAGLIAVAQGLEQFRHLGRALFHGLHVFLHRFKGRSPE